MDLGHRLVGFLLRAVAGGLAADVPLSRWFLIVAAFGSLFVVAGKRNSELVTPGERAAETRPSLRGYSASYLRLVWRIAAAVTIPPTACGPSSRAPDGEPPWGPRSIAPFIVAVLRYTLDGTRGAARGARGDRTARPGPVVLAWLAARGRPRRDRV